MYAGEDSIVRVASAGVPRFDPRDPQRHTRWKTTRQMMLKRQRDGLPTLPAPDAASSSTSSVFADCVARECAGLEGRPLEVCETSCLEEGEEGNWWADKEEEGDVPWNQEFPLTNLVAYISVVLPTSLNSTQEWKEEFRNASETVGPSG